jgi:hypothetical protein
MTADAAKNTVLFLKLNLKNISDGNKYEGLPPLLRRLKIPTEVDPQRPKGRAVPDSQSHGISEVGEIHVAPIGEHIAFIIKHGTGEIGKRCE